MSTFTRYLIDDDATAEELARKKTALRENRGMSDFDGFAAGVLARRMQNHPEQYVEFGPYWWALKEILRQRGHDFGTDAAPALAATYKGETDGATFIKAEMFKELYRQTWAAGTRVFDLTEDGQAYTLVDQDMDGRVLR